jgi:uncharacterized protein YabE (DUF348 family)
MTISNKPLNKRILAALTGGIVAVFFGIILVQQVNALSTTSDSGKRLLTIHDGGAERGLLTRATTLREAFDEAGIPTDPNDRVEPGLDERLEANNYEVNIYRARPVTIIDGTTRTKVMSAYRTAKQIAEQAGITLNDEDKAEMMASTDMVSQGAGVQLHITRAVKFTLTLYGKKTIAYTHAKTAAAMLEEKGITLEADDTLSVAADALIKPGMTIEIWRDGVQTVTVEQPIAFTTERILDVDHPIGYRSVKTKGEPGTRVISYVVEMKDGKEISRKQIRSIVSKQPKKQIERIGNKPVNGLSKSKGAQYFVDSRGVSHRETYYDLPMNITMQHCGGGDYSVRADGAKVDRDGYILVAANLGRYPYCSVVETSLGLGKVYDTGGFAAVHPDGFDLATDWTNYNGR